MSAFLYSLAFASLAAGVALPIPASSDSTCSPLQLVIARGTTEPLNPSYGVIVGDPIFEATSALIPGITGYAIDYPASLEPESRNIGSNDTVRHVQEQVKKCPNQKLVMIGYSQGGDVMHSAINALNPDIFPNIVAVVLFGDPGNRGPQAKSPLNCDLIPPIPSGLASKLKENCEAGDPVCTNDGVEINNHLLYSDPAKGYMAASAEYIKKQFDTNGKAGPSLSPNVGVGDNSAAMLELGKMLGASDSSPKGQCGIGNGSF